MFGRAPSDELTRNGLIIVRRMSTPFNVQRVMMVITTGSALMTWVPALWGWLIQPTQAYRFFLVVGPAWVLAGFGLAFTGLCLSAVTLYRRDWRGLVGLFVAGLTMFWPQWTRFVPYV